MGDFYCTNNMITSLEGSPEKIDGEFNCSYNKLTTLEYCPKEVGLFRVESNPLIDLVDIPEKINKFLSCRYTPICSIFNIVDTEFLNAFNTFKVIKDNVVNLKRLKYVMAMFDKPIFLHDIKKHYKVV